MPNRFKRAGRAFLVFGITAILGVLVFLFVLGGPEAAREPKTTAAKPAPVVIDKISLRVADPAKSSATADILDEEPFAGGANVTHDLGKKLAAEIIKRNPTGPGPAGAQKLTLMKPTEAVDAFIADALKTFDPSIFSPSIDSEALRIIHDSKENFETYFRQLTAILKENFSSIDLRVGDDLAGINFAQANAAYTKTIEQLRALPVPATLAASHKKELELMLAQKNVLNVLAGYNSDPLAAMLAINAGQQISEGFKNLKREAEQFIAKQHLRM